MTQTSATIKHRTPKTQREVGFLPILGVCYAHLYLSTTSPYTRILLMIAKLEQVDLALKFILP